MDHAKARKELLALKESYDKNVGFAVLDSEWWQRATVIVTHALGADSVAASGLKQARDRWSRLFRDSSMKGESNATVLGAIDAAIYELDMTSEPVKDSAPATPEDTSDPSKVFVVFGRDIAARTSMYRFLRSIKLNPIEWDDAVALTGRPSPYIGEVLTAAFAAARAVVVLLTPDEVTELRPELRGSDAADAESGFLSRPNVMFELGMAMALHPDRTVVVRLGKTRDLSDIKGLVTINLTKPAGRGILAARLEAIGCPVITTGADWQTEGDFHAR